jgi:hypothetical protein
VLIPWSTFLLENPTVAKPDKLACYAAGRLINVFARTHIWDLILSQTNPVHTLPYIFLRSILILLSHRHLGTATSTSNHCSIFLIVFYVVKLFVCLTTLSVIQTRQAVLSLPYLASNWSFCQNPIVSLQ